MKNRDWFRNSSWDPEIEAAFFKKLAAARDKSQYLRIQASILAPLRPEVALRLLDLYFAAGEHLQIAQAHVDRATAYLCLGQLDSAVHAYEAALAREATHPFLKTAAYIELPFLIARQGLLSHYERALALLEAHKDQLPFPADRFRWNCARALILADRGDRLTAREAARAALTASAEAHSGYRYHPRMGLVEGIDESLRARLTELTV